MTKYTDNFHSGRVILAPVDAASASGRREYDCIFMQPGWVRRADGSLSTWLIPPEPIMLAAHKFDGLPSHVDHPALYGFGWRAEPQVKDLAGVTFAPLWDEGAQALRGGIRLYDTGPGTPPAFIQALLDQMLEDRAAGREVPGLGLSATIYHVCDEEEEGQRTTREIAHVEAVDFVYSPGAGGYVRAALSAAGYDDSPIRVWNLSTATLAGGTDTMPDIPTQTNTDVDTTTAADDLAQPLAPAPSPPAPDLSAQVAELSAQVASLTQAITERETAEAIEGMAQAPREQHAFRAGYATGEEFLIAFDCLLSGLRTPPNVRPLAGFREAYALVTGDFAVNGKFYPREARFTHLPDLQRGTLAAVTTTTMASITANALNKRVVNIYATYDHWWEPAVTTEDFTSLHDVRWTSLGGVGELPTVAEGAPYVEQTWDDFVETDSFVKKGGYLGITLETIDKDDTRKVMAAPGALAQAAYLTLGKSISAIFTDNSGTGPAMSDSNYLFDASNHSNLLTTALSWSEWQTVKIAMMKQTEINSGERLGALTRPYFLWVPIDLETTAVQILASEGEPGTADNDINPDAQGEGRETRLQVARRRVIVCPLWTDTNNWAAQAHPQLYPAIGLGFRYGRTPELFVASDESAGLMFSNDTMPIKVRWFFAVGPTDWRGLHKSNVS